MPDPDNVIARAVRIAQAAHLTVLASHASRVEAAPIRPAPDAIEQAAAAASAEPPSDDARCSVADFDRSVVDALRHLSDSVRDMCPDEVATLERHAARSPIK